MEAEQKLGNYHSLSMGSGTMNNGYIQHPLYIKSDTQPIQWEKV